MIAGAAVGGLCALALWVIARPFLTRRSTPEVAPPDEAASDALLRQLHDLDDDLARGTVSPADHARLRGPLERQAAEALRVAGPAAERRGPAEPPAQQAPRTRRARRLGILAAVAALAAALAVVAGTQLTGAVGRRPAAPSGADRAAALEPVAPGREKPSAAALAAVREAVHRVRRAPRAAGPHVALAGAYAQAGQSQLATLEYLAARRLDPGNPEAGTALALTAFRSGKSRLAASLVDRVLRADPGYPEALYVRGLVEAMGLHHPRAAARSFRGYLDAAPVGSHRTSAETLLALLKGDET